MRYPGSLRWWPGVALVAALGIGAPAGAQDWPQWRGPLGQGITSAKDLPPAAGSSSLKVLWKTPLPGEGCSSPVVSQGRVYLTAAYEGSQQHAWDRPAFWATVLLACGVTGLALTQVPQAWRSVVRGSFWMAAAGSWTVAIVVLTTVVLCQPLWFWQFADPWTGTAATPARLPWVESMNLRPAIVFACGSLVLVFIWLAPSARAGAADAPSPPLLSDWLRLLTAAVTAAAGVALGLIGWQPDWFFQDNQPWLAWLVTGGLGLFALAGGIGWLGERGRMWPRIVMIGVGLALAGWLFQLTPEDEFGYPLHLYNRIVYLAPALLLLFLHAWFLLLARGRAWPGPSSSRAGERLTGLLFLAAALLPVVSFVRPNYLRPQSGVVRAVLCLDARSGAVLWNTQVFVAPAEKRHSLNSQATPTPACDGERVYAYFGSGVAALDRNGRLLWLQRDPEFASFIRYGAGSSIALAGDRLILFRDSEFMGHGDHLDDDVQGQQRRRPTTLTALDKASGAECWSVTPPFAHDSYMTPLVWERDGRPEVVIATWKTLAAFSLNDGSMRWEHSYPMQQIVPSPAVHRDCLIVTGGNVLPCPVLSVRAPAAGAPAQTGWFNRKTGGNIVSPVCWKGRLFSMSDAGVLTCLDAETGQVHYTQRLGGRFLASLVAGDGKLYALDQEGTLTVLAADTSGTVLATHSFLESCSATPALTEGALFVRTAGHLYRLGSGR